MMKLSKGIAMVKLGVVGTLMLGLTACGGQDVTGDLKDDSTVITTEVDKTTEAETEVDKTTEAETEADKTTEAETEADKTTEVVEDTTAKTMTVYYSDGTEETVTDNGDETWVTPQGAVYYEGTDGVLRARGAEDLFIENPAQ